MKKFKIVLCLLSILIFQNTLAQKKILDHYLKGEPEPLWMVRGVPAIEKGINQGYELLNKNK